MSSFKLISARFSATTTDLEREIVTVANGAMLGKTNNTGTVTLTANAVSTVVSMAPGLIGPDTVFLFSPTTANAAAEFGGGSMYVSARSVPNSTFTITHANNAQTDRTFSYVFIG